MSEQSFNLGDVVQLKSGGPHLTITEVDGDTATCLYADGNNQLHRHTISVVALKHVLTQSDRDSVVFE